MSCQSGASEMLAQTIVQVLANAALFEVDDLQNIPL
jgi:hypothetical protein